MKALKRSAYGYRNFCRAPSKRVGKSRQTCGLSASLHFGERALQQKEA
jgi:hypothetical protein